MTDLSELPDEAALLELATQIAVAILDPTPGVGAGRQRRIEFTPLRSLGLTATRVRSARAIELVESALLAIVLGAAGGIEAIFSVLAIHEQVAPPTINLDSPDPQCDLDYVPNASRRQAIRTALSNSFAFGGNNSTLVVRRLVA